MQNVVGFDLNPLAVLAARTTFLLALGPLLRHVRPLEIPVYLCDSVLLPKPEGGGLLSRGRRLTTSVGPFVIPGAIDSPEKMVRFAEILERAIRNGHTVEGVATSVAKSLGDLDVGDLDLLRELYARLERLNAEGKNGIWPRIIKNSFAPVFVSKDRFDYVIGNPPWVNWESLSDEYRRATTTLWREQGLFSLIGHEARLGGGKKDLSMLMTYVAAQEYLRPGGTLAFLITQTVFKTMGAGAGFRRFRLADTTALGVRVVHDFSVLQPFEGATNRTAAFVLQRDAETTYPVRWVDWQAAGRRRPKTASSLTDVIATTTRTEMVASPVRARDKTSPWLTVASVDVAALRQAIGKSYYRGYTGAYTGGLDGAFLVEITGRRTDRNLAIRNLHDAGKIKVEAVNTTIESDLVYPLLRGRDVQRWTASPSTNIVLAQDPVTRQGIAESVMRDDLPLTYEYLSRFRPQMVARAAFRKFFEPSDPFYSMYNVGSYTLSPWKTVWRQQASVMTAAVCGSIQGRVVIPNHKLTLVPTETPEEAHYLCAVLNSTVVAGVVRGYAIPTGITTHVLDHVAIPRYDPTNPGHVELAELARLASNSGTADDQQIDDLVLSLWL